MFGCSASYISITLMVRLWRSWEPHQPKRSSTDCAFEAAAAVGLAAAPPLAGGGGAGFAAGELHAAATRATPANRLCSRVNAVRRRIAVAPPGSPTRG